jgi:hypothetical protein
VKWGGPQRRCQIDGKRSVENLRRSTASHSFRNSGDLAPHAERSGTSGAVIIGSQAMAAKLEVPHLPFSSCRLMRHLDPVVEN